MFLRFVAVFLRFIPIQFFVRGMGVLLEARLLQERSAKKQLISLFHLSARLENLLASAGTQYGGGSHVKHRLTQYHDFFVHNIRKTESVLDVGCGAGEVAIDIARRTGANVTGIDIEPTYIMRAQQKSQSRVRFVQGDAVSYEFSVQPFDTLVLSNVLEHIEHRPQFLKTLFKKSGASRALIRVPLLERDWTVPMRRELGLEWRLDNTHFTEYTVPQFEQEMKDAGVEIKNLTLRWSEIWAEVSLGAKQ